MLTLNSASNQVIVQDHPVSSLVDWLEARGYPQAWCSTGWTYEGLDKAWRIQRTYAVPRRWTVSIGDPKLMFLFAIKFS
jgi:hypothetical protein